MSASAGADTLTLRPVADEERQALLTVLNEPRLQRISLVSGIHRIQRIEWSESQRTFAVASGGVVMGTVDLRRDDDEPTTWELTVVLDVEGQQHGARAGLAGLFYAFATLGAEAVWFWTPKDKEAVQKFAARLGFVKLTELQVPGGTTTCTFELDRHAWETQTAPALVHYLVNPVDITDGQMSWRGEGSAFYEL